MPDAHRDDGKRLVVHADEKLTAFVELNRRFELLKHARTPLRARESQRK